MTDADIVGSVRSGLDIGKSIGNAFIALIWAITRPLMLVTQVFFRTSMGERYFTASHLFAGGSLIGIATLLSVLIPIPSHRGFLGTVWTISVGVVWMFLFSASFVECVMKTHERYAKGELWHSYNSGEPRAPWLTNRVQYTLTVCLIVGLALTGQFIPAMLMLLSWCFGFMHDAYAAKAFWNKVLDSVDARIEATFLGEAIEQRLRPQQAHGLQVTVPAHANSDYWKKIEEKFRAAGTKAAEMRTVPTAAAHVEVKRGTLTEPHRESNVQGGMEFLSSGRGDD